MIAGRQAYDYLICVDTGKVIEFSSEKLRKLRDEICAEHGLDPMSHQFHIFAMSPSTTSRAGVAIGGKDEAARRKS
jgi:Fe2+ or Zn2+ uptake regulation protein